MRLVFRFLLIFICISSDLLISLTASFLVAASIRRSVPVG
jgi:hypothetical protein